MKAELERLSDHFFKTTSQGSRRGRCANRAGVGFIE